MTAAPVTQTTTLQNAARAVRESVLVVAAPDRAAILVSGKDRTSWLNGLVTCELAKRERGQGAYGLLVEKKGRIQTDLFVVPSTDEGEHTLALAVPASLRDTLLPGLDHYLIMEDAELTASDLVFFVAHGPRAAELRALAPFAGTVDLLGTGGIVLGASAADAAALEARLREAVAKLGGVLADDATWDAVRIEHGLPRFGAEVDATQYPQEAALEKLAVSFSKGCYLGQEVVYMLQERGHVKRKLVPLDLDEGGDVPVAGTAVTTPAGEAVGEIKSAVMGPSSGKPVAIAMVKWAHAKPATELRVGTATARVR
ncbi:MAG: Folate-dependent protein for Fe/S cluster synthesis/repair in oxidative stress [Myxococcaceae bacterium]|nr:Folate-dependent protein for Fe/S cluster synthesis/repair in oxidative stress [Myxococcaceae bacterium]